ncbi:hydroxylase [Mycolicibacter kumamotonensis]|jgi:alkylation response protein AidB-like acyl-CoA dehydrogenase|uniref:Hydroxylase n=1 Tax=Mycolicibacter kumamotonensis TaxID=354243 RepID=A0A1B8SDU9_9MYCO|nr:hydroxylase [Mycolicibacter kumamotonensis]OBY30928.1 hydroxylase [Mycolicibacter kumamotonensis]
MAHVVVERVEQLAAQLADTAEDSERPGTLSSPSVALIRRAGVMRMLQPTDFGGYAAHPRDFAEAVMAVAKRCGAAGWVCGVGGVHRWEMALMDRRLQAEVWGSDPDAWIASRDAAQGLATPVDGGYRLEGRWDFCSGTDHCDWIFLGARVADTLLPKVLHVVLPRSDYMVIEDSWDVTGLSGSGGKDIVVDGAFVPAYRTIDFEHVAAGVCAAEAAGRPETLYRLPFWAMLPLGITAAVIGIAEGALAAHVDYQRDQAAARINSDPSGLCAISEAAAEIAASRGQLLDGISRLFDLADAGEVISCEERALAPRNQLRCAQRAVAAVDAVFARSGGNAARGNNPLQRFWRDAHVGLAHAVHLSDMIYQSSALTAMEVAAPQGLRAMI